MFIGGNDPKWWQVLIKEPGSLLIILTLLAIAGSFVAVKVIDRYNQFFSIDKCIDNGGCWDYNVKVCRKGEPNAQKLCDESK